MVLVDMIHKLLSHYLSGEGVQQRDKVGVLGHLVDHHHDAIVLARRWQSVDEVHGGHLQGLV